MIPVNNAHVIVHSEDFQERRPCRSTNHESAATADSKCCNIWSREVGIDSQYSVTALAVAEVGAGISAVEIVVARTECINDVRAKKVRAAECQCLVQAIGAVSGTEQVSGQVIAHWLPATLPQITTEQRMVVGHLVVHTA